MSDLGVSVAGCRPSTIESLAEGDRLHSLQWAGIERGGFQCGICTSGQITAAKALLDTNPHPSGREIRSWLVGNLCRWTGYYQNY